MFMNAKWIKPDDGSGCVENVIRKEKMREEFEKLPEIKLRLLGMVFCHSKNKYIPKNTIIKEVVKATGEVNLAWYAYQEQQKKIDKVASIIHDAYISDGNSSVEIIYFETQELLK